MGVFAIVRFFLQKAYSLVVYCLPEMENDAPVIYGLEFQVCSVQTLVREMIALEISDN